MSTVEQNLTVFKCLLLVFPLLIQCSYVNLCDVKFLELVVQQEVVLNNSLSTMWIKSVFSFTSVDVKVGKFPAWRKIFSTLSNTSFALTTTCLLGQFSPTVLSISAEIFHPQLSLAILLFSCQHSLDLLILRRKVNQLRLD